MVGLTEWLCWEDGLISVKPRTSQRRYLVVLSDNLVADPRMLRDLHSQGVAHLAVRVRDGTGLVGPRLSGVARWLTDH